MGAEHSRKSVSFKDGFKTWQTRSGYRITLVLPGPSKAFLVSCGGLNILVDSGSALAGKPLDKRLERAGICHLDYLILTHTHFDHTGNAHRIREKYGPKVIVHLTEAALLESGKTVLPGGTNFFTKMLIRHSPRIADKFYVEPCKADIVVEEGFDFPDEGIRAHLLHTPGHTCGSVSLIVDGEIALVGDAMIGRSSFSVFPPFADDVPQLMHSWRKLLDTGCRLFMPSHGSSNKWETVEKSYKKHLHGINPGNGPSG